MPDFSGAILRRADLFILLTAYTLALAANVALSALAAYVGLYYALIPGITATVWLLYILAAAIVRRRE